MVAWEWFGFCNVPSIQKLYISLKALLSISTENYARHNFQGGKKEGTSSLIRLVKPKSIRVILSCTSSMTLLIDTSLIAIPASWTDLIASSSSSSLSASSTVLILYNFCIWKPNMPSSSETGSSCIWTTGWVFSNLSISNSLLMN